MGNLLVIFFGCISLFILCSSSFFFLSFFFFFSSLLLSSSSSSLSSSFLSLFFSLLLCSNKFPSAPNSQRVGNRREKFGSFVVEYFPWADMVAGMEVALELMDVYKTYNRRNGVKVSHQQWCQHAYYLNCCFYHNPQVGFNEHQFRNYHVPLTGLNGGRQLKLGTRKGDTAFNALVTEWYCLVTEYKIHNCLTDETKKRLYELSQTPPDPATLRSTEPDRFKFVYGSMNDVRQSPSLSLSPLFPLSLLSLSLSFVFPFFLFSFFFFFFFFLFFSLFGHVV